jgi:molybdopterin converting factor small subunit
MQVTVKLVGGLRTQAGIGSIPVEIPDGGTYRHLVDAIGPTIQAKLPAWAWDADRRTFSRRMMISRNGVTELRDETTVLAEGDEILVVLPLAGG